MTQVSPPEELFRALTVATRHLTAHIEQEVASAAAVSLPEFEILGALNEAPERRARAGELGTMLQWEKSRISHQVTRMERRGLVKRVSCAADHRGTWVELTERGADCLSHAQPVFRAALDGLLGDVASSPDGKTVTLMSLDLGARVMPAMCENAVSQWRKAAAAV